MDRWAPPSANIQSEAFTTVSDQGETMIKRLVTLIEGAPERWTYAIFWRTCVDDDNPSSTLNWGDGFFKGCGNGYKHRSSSFPGDQQHRKSVVRELKSRVSVSQSPDDQFSGDEEVGDTEWFFVISMTRNFVNGSGLPGEALYNSSTVWLTGAEKLATSSCSRAREAQGFGIETLVCIPSLHGVVELGSTDLNFQNSELEEMVKFLFNFDQNASVFCSLMADESDFSWLVKPSTDLPGFNDIADNDDLCVSKHVICQWNISSADSEIDVKYPLKRHGKRGRKPANGKMETMNHAEAERQRRVKLNGKLHALRAILPKLPKKDKSSLLGETITHINGLKSIIKKLELDNENLRIQLEEPPRSADRDLTINNYLDIDAKMVGTDSAMIWIKCCRKNHTVGKLMGVLRDLELEIEHAIVFVVKDLITQQVMVKTETRFSTQLQLISTIMSKM